MNVFQDVSCNGPQRFTSGSLYTSLELNEESVAIIKWQTNSSINRRYTRDLNRKWQYQIIFHKDLCESIKKFFQHKNCIFCNFRSNQLHNIRWIIVFFRINFPFFYWKTKKDYVARGWSLKNQIFVMKNITLIRLNTLNILNLLRYWLCNLLLPFS